MIRIVRQGKVPATRERWILRGVVKIITHPLPPHEGRPRSSDVAGAAGPGAGTRSRSTKGALSSGS